MSSKNRPVKLMLEEIYGKGCMFQKAYVSERLKLLNEELIKRGKEPVITYGTYKKKYTLNQQRTLERRMTLHHLKHKSEGGKTNIENGAVVSELAHRYMHLLPRAVEERANDMLREYKKQIDNGLNTYTAEDLKNFEECKIELDPVEEIDLPAEVNIVTGQFDLDGKFKPQKKAKKKYNRAKHKRKTKKLIKRYYGER